VCGSKKAIEASHTGPHGIGQKSPDSSAIPLCQKHHRTGADSYHRLGPRKFSEKHNLDIPAIVRRLNLKPTIRVESGCYVTFLDGQRYVLGKTDAGIQSAIREALQLCREISWSRRLPPDNLYDRYSAQKGVTSEWRDLNARHREGHSFADRSSERIEQAVTYFL